MRFADYVQFRSDLSLAENFDVFCGLVAGSGLDVDEVLSECVMPALSEASPRDENELMEGILGSIKNWFGRGQGEEDWGFDDEQDLKKQMRAQEITQAVKNKFLGYLHRFIKEMEQRSYDTNDPHTWKTVQSLEKRLRQTVDGFQMRHVAGPAAYKADFNSQRDMVNRKLGPVNRSVPVHPAISGSRKAALANNYGKPAVPPTTPAPAPKKTGAVLRPY